MTMENLVCIVHYNTPELTAYTVRSLKKWTPDCKVVIFDNSDRMPWQPIGDEEVFDNTKGQIINFDHWLDGFPHKLPSPRNNYGSAKHCLSVQWLLDYLATPFVLVDSDVLIRCDISKLWDDRYLWVGEVGSNTGRFGISLFKVHPFLCYLNADMMRKKHIYYFNPRKMWDLTNKVPNRYYDTGAWLYEVTIKMRMRYKLISLNRHCFHLRHGSWKDTKWREWVEEHRETWE